MCLGDMILKLGCLPPDLVMPIAIADPHSYRGYYSDLAFSEDRDTRQTARDALSMAGACLGQFFDGYKGGEYNMGIDAPVWIAFYGSCGRMLVSIDDHGTLVTVEERQEP